MKTLIPYLIFLLLSLNAFSKISDYNEDKKPYSIISSIISPDGKWLLYSKMHNETNTTDDLYLINTETKETLTKTFPSKLFRNLLKEDIGVYQENKTITIVDFTKPDFSSQRHDILEFNTDPKRNLLYTLNENGDLTIEELRKNKQTKVFQATNIKKYFLNKSKTYLVYQEKGDNKAIVSVDLKTFKKQFLTSISINLKTVEWNLFEDAILFSYEKSNNQMLVNLKDRSIRKIELPLGEYSYFEKNFYSNNDILITFNINTNEKHPESEYLDIWSSNSRSVITTDYTPKYKFNYYAKIYKYESEELIELQRDRFKEYFPTSIPDYVIYYNQFEHQDFLSTYPKVTYYLENIKTKKKTLLSTASQAYIYTSPDNTKLLFQKDNSYNWEVMDLEENTRFTIDHDQPFYRKPLWSIDGKSIYYQNNNNLIKLDLENIKKTRLTNFNKATTIGFLNVQKANSLVAFVDSSKPLIIKVTKDNENAIFKVDEKQITPILPFTPNRIPSLDQIRQNISNDYQTIVWKEENFNLPHTLFMYKGKKKELLLKSDLQEVYNWQKREKICFKDSTGKELEGYLYYPKNFDPTKKYPMITEIYEKAWNSLAVNRFTPPTFLNGTGYNRILLNEQGYFVFNPDTYIDERGPGLAAVDCVENAIKKVLKQEPAINENKIGLSGHSFGGYEATFIVAQSNLFAAVISFAGIQDLIGSFTYKYNNDRKLPEYSRVENSQFSMQQSFAENPQKYYDNSPLLQAHKIKTPILLTTGLNDENVHWEQTRTMFWALKRYNNTQFVALLYNGIGHAFNPYIEADKPLAKDYTMRYLDWFDYYLKDNKSIEWIEDAVNPAKISASYLNFR